MNKRAKPNQSVGSKRTPQPSKLPEGWAMAKLADVTLAFQSIKPEAQPARVWRYADIGGVDSIRNVMGATRKFLGSDAPSRARRPVQSGDVLFSNVRVNLKKIAYVPEPSPVDVCSTGFTVLRSNGALAPRYLFHAVLRSEFISAVEETQTGTQYPATSDRQVREIAIPVPPLTEQARIADKLDALSGQIHTARERLQSIPIILERLAIRHLRLAVLAN